MLEVPCNKLQLVHPSAVYPTCFCSGINKKERYS